MKSFIPPYDESYALTYNTNWCENKFWLEESKFIKTIIGELLQGRNKWIDAGCGTGYFLKQFKDINKAGFDFSETMLSIAKEENPEALFFESHNISIPKEEWNNQWDLVTCMGQPWTYLNDIRLIEKTVENLYHWTSDENGVCLLIPDDVQDGYEMNISYCFSQKEYELKQFSLNALTWTYHNEKGNHLFLIAPLLDQWIRWFSRYFNEINIAYKKFETHKTPRVYIICSKKKPIPNLTEPEIYFEGINLNELIERLGKDNLSNRTIFQNK